MLWNAFFDEREASVEFKVARVVNGEKAQDYAVDQTGNRVRDSLFLMLRKRGVRNFDLKSEHLAEQEIPEMFRIKLNAYGSLLRKYGKDILADSPTALTA